MKNVALLLFLLLACGQMFSQNYEYTDRWGNVIFNFTMLEDGSYFLAGNDGHVGADYSIFRPDGSKLELETYTSRASDFQFKVDPTGGYLVSYFDFSCDVIGSHVIKLNEDGEQVWWSFSDLFGYVLDIAVFPNGDFLYALETKIFKSDNDGQFIWDLELGEEIMDIGVDTSSFVYVALEDGIFKLDSNGIDLDIMMLQPVSHLTVLENQNIAAYDSTSVYFFDNELNLINDIEITSSEYIIDVAYGAEYFSVLYGDDLSPSNKKVITFDYSLSELGSFDLGFNHVSWEGIGLRNDEIILAGREFYGMNRLGSVVKSFSIEGNTANYMEDVALYDLTIDSLGSDTLIFYGPKATLENNGDDTLHSVWVSVVRGVEGVWICPYRRVISEEFANLALAPGESMELHLQDLDFKDAVVNDVDLCYYAHLPNRHIDLDNSDNFTCLYFYVDAKEVVFENAVIHIYPNPASYFLNINMSGGFNDNMELSIYDTYGRMVRNETIAKNEKDKTLGVGGLGSGVYFLKIKEKNTGEIYSELISIVR